MPLAKPNHNLEKAMKIVVVSQWFSEKMGYAENHLPAAFGRQGHEVHLVTTDLQVYATYPKTYDSVYRTHLGSPSVPTGVYPCDGYTLHRLPHSRRGGLSNPGLAATLERLSPDIVYCFEIMDSDYQTVAENRLRLGYRIFCESRLHTSVLSRRANPWKMIRNWIRRRRSIRLAKEVTMFYPIAPDVTKNIISLLGIPEVKCKQASLAVDVGNFRVIETPGLRSRWRDELGFAADDIVCVYTGRFVPEKGPLSLAEAIRLLRQRGFAHYRAIFVGQGDQAMIEKLSSVPGCQTHPFVGQPRLAEIYNAVDIGVWPKQESTSQLDAAACGLPLVLDAAVEDKWRTEGNGLTYDGSPAGLAETLLRMEDSGYRRKLGACGSAKVAGAYSWDKVARAKLADFELSLSARSKAHE